MESAWRFDGSALSMRWKYLRGEGGGADGHNTRIIDVDGDGKDEVTEIGFVLNGDGTLRYNLADQGVIHGDRWFVGDVDSSRPGLEVWSFSGVWNAGTNRLTAADATKSPWPAFTLQWDGDVSAELLNDGRIEEWNPAAPSVSKGLPRLFTVHRIGAYNAGQNNPALIGDLFGDWREEAVYSSAANDELIILTTGEPSDVRLYTLAQNPAYRIGMTLKGYLQSHQTDYYLGAGMSAPPRPAIHYAG